MSRNEVAETFSRYGIFDGVGVTVFDESADIEILVDFLRSGTLQPCEHPDAFVKAGNKVLIIEHFAMDGYKELPNGGSELLRNESMQTKEFSKIPATEDGIHLTRQLGTSNSYSGFIENCKRRFEQHYTQIEAYKRHLCDKGIADDTTEFFVCFLMDEVSPLGTLTYDGENICPVCLAKSNEFLDFYESHPNVDWIISAVVLPSGYSPYFLSYNNISVYREQALDYASYQFLSSNPMRTDFKVIIPKEKLDGIS